MKSLLISLLLVVALAIPVVALDRPEEKLLALADAKVERKPGWCLTRTAERLAHRLQDAQALFHARPRCPAGRWGQVVGVGPSVRAVFRAFMRSPEHRAVLLDGRTDLIGVGVVVGPRETWVVINTGRSAA